MSAVPRGLPRARAQTVQLVETSEGSWKTAPDLSVAFASNTWKLPPGGAGARRMVLTLLMSAKFFPAMPPTVLPAVLTSWTKIRCPSLLFMSAVLSFGTPIMLRLKCEPLGAPLPVVVTEAVPVVVVVAVVVCATFVVFAVLARAGATAYAPATYAGTAAIEQATTSDRIRPIAKASRPSP